MITSSLKIISTTTKMILATNTLMSATWKVILVSTKLSLTTEDEITGTLKVILATKTDLGHWGSHPTTLKAIPATHQCGY